MTTNTNTNNDLGELSVAECEQIDGGYLDAIVDVPFTAVYKGLLAAVCAKQAWLHE
jgi:hypothetical protein